MGGTRYGIPAGPASGRDNHGIMRVAWRGWLLLAVALGGCTAPRHRSDSLPECRWSTLRNCFQPSPGTWFDDTTRGDALIGRGTFR